MLKPYQIHSPANRLAALLFFVPNAMIFLLVLPLVAYGALDSSSSSSAASVTANQMVGFVLPFDDKAAGKN